MKRGAPMKRMPFKSRALSRSPAGIVQDQQVADETATAGHRRAPARRGTYGPATLTALPKPVEHRRPRLLALAKNMPCLLRVTGVCNNNPATTVACHSNWAEHGGKGGARKADDQYSVWGCSACHRWLDQGPAPAAAKKRAFMQAHRDQVMFWRAIATDTSTKQPDRDAAVWALALLNATAVASLETP